MTRLIPLVIWSLLTAPAWSAELRVGAAAVPITPPVGPVMPTSVMYAVPPGSTRPSAVGTWVWVPTHALTRPSRCQPIATFSLVSSA